MSGEVANHLWQSTVFTLAAYLLTLAFRNNRARVRYWLWFAASVKWLIPFALLMALGSQLAWAPAAKEMATPAVALPIVQISQPFAPRFDAAITPAPSTATTGTDWVAGVATALWACGFAAIVMLRMHTWRRLQAAVRASVPWTAPGVVIPARIEARAAAGLMEPGVVGVWRPIVLVPMGIERDLTTQQLEAVLAHERHHIERRDNLTATIHMVVEAVFWFHPLVWWIGARLLHERERACDEQVLRELGEPQTYAEAILNVCRRYVEPPLACVSGVGGADLKRRLEAIVSGRIGLRMTIARRVTLAIAMIAAFALPILAGMMSASAAGLEPQVVARPAAPPFDVVLLELDTTSLTRTPDPIQRNLDRLAMPLLRTPMSAGRFRMRWVSLRGLIRIAYDVAGFQIEGGPAWLDSDLYNVDLKADNASPEQMRLVLQSMLIDRFKLTLRREERELTVYELVAAPGGVRISPMEKGGCIPIKREERPPTWDPRTPFCGVTRQILSPRPDRRDRIELKGVSMQTLLEMIVEDVGGPVVDRTGFTGPFIASLEFPVGPPPGFNSPIPSVSAALQELGLQLNPKRDRVEVLTIEGAGRPAEK